MATNLKKFFSTYATNLLSEWTTLTALMRKDTQPAPDPREAEGPVSTAPQPVTQEQIFAALETPFANFYQQFFDAYAKLMRVKMELTIRDSELFKKDRRPLEGFKQISEKVLTKITVSDLEQIAQQLNEAATSYHMSWEERLPEWDQAILSALGSAGINLSVLESANFQTEVLMPELYNRFTDLKVPLPKPSSDTMNFQQYLQLKTVLLIQSALSRQHQPHGESDIKAVLKKIKSTFDAIGKQEQQLIKAQSKTLQEITQKIEF